VRQVKACSNLNRVAAPPLKSLLFTCGYVNS
jgi:hypothetical protein